MLEERIVVGRWAGHNNTIHCSPRPPPPSPPLLLRRRPAPRPPPPRPPAPAPPPPAAPSLPASPSRAARGDFPKEELLSSPEQLRRLVLERLKKRQAYTESDQRQ